MNLVNWFNRNFAFWKKPTVFISSTYRDLVRERFTIAEELAFKGYEVIKMEDIEDPGAIDIVDWSMQNAAACEIYLLLLSFRYGTRALVFEGDESGYSITRLEAYSGMRFGKAVTYFLKKPFYDEDLLLSPEGYEEEAVPQGDFDRETVNGMVAEIEVDAIFLTEQFKDYPAVVFTEKLAHTQEITAELEKREGVPGRFIDDLMSYPEDISEEELEELNRKREADRQRRDQYLARYPNVREKEDILANIRHALLNSTIYRDIYSTQAMMKYLVADVEILENIQRYQKLRRFFWSLVALIILAGVVIWWL